MKYRRNIGLVDNVKLLFIEVTKLTDAVRSINLSLQKEDQANRNEAASAKETSNITFVALAETRMLDDNTAARHAEVFPRWAVGVYFTAGQMRQDPETGGLYRCNQAHTSVAGWEPHLTPALWTVVDVTHAGTKEDPIPAARSMEFTFGLYYTDPEDGMLYICQRTGEVAGGTITLAYLPHELVGQYFEEVTM